MNNPENPVDHNIHDLNTGYLQDNLLRSNLRSNVFNEYFFEGNMNNPLLRLSSLLERIKMYTLENSKLKEFNYLQLQSFNDDLEQMINEIDHENMNPIQREFL